MVVTYHWAVLYNFGQIAPTMYQRARSGPDFDAFGTPNFTEAVNYPPTNNIFYNETHFIIYSNYLTQTLVPMGRKFGIAYHTLPEFLPVNDQNRIQNVPASFVTSYVRAPRDN
jgi:hypothetical protein